jgi:hypothetical protein
MSAQIAYEMSKLVARRANSPFALVNVVQFLDCNVSNKQIQPFLLVLIQMSQRR